MVERAVIAGSEPVRILPPPAAPNSASFEHRDSPAAGSPVLVLAELERGAILKALELAGGVRTRAAHLLGITRQALERKIEKHGITLRS
jgi:DNA-binding NtrC family response regulator